MIIEPSRKKSKLTLFSSLVLFVFVILFAAAAMTGILAYFLSQNGILDRMADSRFPTWILVLLIPSIIIGTILTALSGRRSLRPFQRMITATREVAAGNFDTRLPVHGPKELQILSESFNAMAKELGSIETLRSDFVSNISHEFKTPIVSIKGFAKLLKKDTLPPERRREYLDIIISESERLANLSSNVLLISKIESQDNVGNMRSFSLDEQIRRSVLLLEPQCSRKRMELEIELEPIQITANDELLHHVWLNLLSNAVKFSRPQGRLTISAHAASDAATVMIADTGIGMEPDVREHLFDKFYQGDKSRTTEGNGLGLSLAKRIVDLHEGAIQVDSEIEKGSCFTVTLPLRNDEAI